MYLNLAHSAEKPTGQNGGPHGASRASSVRCCASMNQCRPFVRLSAKTADSYLQSRGASFLLRARPTKDDFAVTNVKSSFGDERAKWTSALLGLIGLDLDTSTYTAQNTHPFRGNDINGSENIDLLLKSPLVDTCCQEKTFITRTEYATTTGSRTLRCGMSDNRVDRGFLIYRQQMHPWRNEFKS